ncbi:TPA: PDZ domain-containing protein, partial [Streptococcus agalactiae]
LSTNQVRVSENGPAASAGLKNNDRILQIGSHKVSNWEQLTAAVEKSTRHLEKKQKLALKIKSKEVVKTINVKPQKVDKSYIIGIMPALKTSFKDKLLGG